MSKSKKRMIVRLSIVAVVLGLGVFALIQAQGGTKSIAPDKNAEGGEGDDSGTSDRPTGQADDKDQFPAGDINPYGPTVFSPREADSAETLDAPPMPAPQAVIRGQFDESEINLDEDSPARGLVGDLPANIQSIEDVRGFQTNGAVPIRPIPKSIGARGEEQDERPLDDYYPSKNGGVGGYVGDGPADDKLGAPRIPAGSGAGNQNLKQAPLFNGQSPRNLAIEDETRPNRLPPAATPRGLSEQPAFGGGAIGASSSTDGNTPGPQHLEGVQAPSLALEKRAPGEIQVGKPAVFQLKIQNVGQVDAHQVTVVDQIPRGTRFIDSTPPADRGPDGSLVWSLGTLRPSDNKTISVQLTPMEEGEIGSVARVMFQAQSSVRTICTRPLLAIEHAAPQRVLIGDNLTLSIKISNPGTGDATGVIIEEDVPDGLSHPAGKEREYEIGTLRPGESRELKLSLKAERAGVITNRLLVRGDGNIIEEDAVDIEVIAPQLQVDMAGPSRRYLERQATYTVSVANPGTAPAKDVELVAYLPKGLKFVETNNQGKYDATKHAVYWNLEELPPNEIGACKLTALPIESGEQKLRIEGRAEMGLVDSREGAVTVEGLAELFFDVADTADPIEVGSDTYYQVRVINQGSKTATNIQLVAEMPGAIQPVGGDGPTRSRVEDQMIIFEPLARLAPKEDVLFKIQARGLGEGDQRVRVRLISDEIRTPITKEESTRVYRDR